MNKIILMLLLMISVPAMASVGYVKGKVQYIRVHDKTAHSSGWAPPIFWFTLQGVSSAKECGVWNGNVLFVMDTDQAYSMILGAYMADKEISVRFDDTLRAPSAKYCKATHITTGSPPPLF